MLRPAYDGRGMRNRIRVLLVIGHRMVREGMGLLLGSERSIKIIGSLKRSSEMVDLCRTDTPDVVIVELNGVGTQRRHITELKELCPRARFIGVAEVDDGKVASQVITLGLSGVYVQTAPSEVLVDLVTRAAAGETVRSIGNGAAPSMDGEEFLLGRLTPREIEVLQELAGGKPTGDVADALGISPLTVQSHVKSILAKLGVHSKIEAVT